MEVTGMKRAAIMEMADAITATIGKYHGPDGAKDAMLQADYVAFVFFGLCDMGLHKLDEPKRHEEYAQIAANLKVMSGMVASHGIGALAPHAQNRSR